MRAPRTEAQVRIDLAAAYRLAALNGWDDTVYTHLSASVPGEPGHYLINRFGLLFEEVSASNLVKVDVAGRVIDGSGAPVNPSGFAIHGAVHAARPEIECVIHLHSPWGVALSMLPGGLQPTSQWAMRLHGRLGRHAYEAARRGAHVVVADLSDADMKDVRGVLTAMIESGEINRSAVAGTMAADATRLPFADASIDRIIASEVCEHIPDDAGAFAEFARVLKPGGRLAVTVPSYLPEKVCWAITDEYHAPKVAGGHVRIYRLAGLRRLLRDAGLTPVASHRAHALHSPYWWLKCAVGPRRNDHPLVAKYRKFLEWEIVEQPRSLAVAERTLAPVLGKSYIVYGTKS